MRTNFVVTPRHKSVDKVSPISKNFVVPRPPNHLLLFLLLILSAASLRADTVYFNDINRAPADSLQIGNVVVSSFLIPFQPPANYQPTTVAGIGLGGSFIQPGFSVDARFHYSPDSLYTDSPIFGRTERLLFEVDGDITAITIVPYRPFVVGSGAMLTAPFSLEWEGAGILGHDLRQLDLSTLDPLTIEIHHQISGIPLDSFAIWNNVDSLQEGSFIPYRLDHLSEEQTIQWGFTVLSLDFAPIPEPTVTSLFAVGGLGFWCVRRKGGRVG